MVKIQAIFAALALGAVVHGQAVRAPKGETPGSLDSFNRLYNTDHQTVFTGKVVGKSVIKDSNGAPNSMALLIKAKNGNIPVQLGPQWFVSNQNAKVNVGDSVRVIGSNVTWKGYHQVMAKQIINLKNKSVLALRDLQGAPYWVAARPASQDRVADNSLGGTVLSQGTTNYQGTPYTSYLLDTPNGNVNILTAPNWYMANQSYVIPVGAYVNVVTGPVTPVGIGNGVVFANSLYSGGQNIVLQNNGYPVWYGYNGYGYGH